jgi:hypothetical protein
MDRRTRALFALALIALVAVAGGVALLSGGGRAGPSGPDESVRGVIVGIESEGLDRIRSFELRTDDGQTLAFDIGVLETAGAFPPGHLAEHQATAQPVRVWYVRKGDAKVAVRLEDAP